MASNVGPPRVIQALKYVGYKNIPGVTAFAFHYSKNYHYSATLTLELDDSKFNSPTRARYERRWNARTEPLWWTAMSPMSVEHKRTVRSWCARRLRLAFVECLQKQGYNADGIQIRSKDGDDPLKGTVQMFARPSLVQTKTPELTQQMELAVERLIREQTSREVPKKNVKRREGQAMPNFEKRQVQLGKGHRKVVLDRQIE